MTPQERAAFIKAEFRKLDIRQCEIAGLLDVSATAVNRVVNGNRGSERIARAIAEAIGQPFDRLFPEIARREEIKRSMRPVEKPRRPVVDAAALARLRREVKYLMIDLSLDNRKRSKRSLLVESVSARLGRRITRQVLSMALSGYRPTAVSLAILEALRDILNEKLSTAA